MVPTNSDIYAYQILHFLVTKHNYQIVTIKQQRKDIWLMNKENDQYPVIRLSAATNAETLANTDYLRNAHRAILDIIQRESKLFIINTNTESTPIDNDFLSQIQLFPDTLSSEKFAVQFPGIENVVHHVEDNQKEYAKLTRSLEETQMKLLKQHRKKVNSFKNIPRMTGIIAIVCIVYAILANMVAFYLENQVIAAILTGAFYKMNIVSMHEYWRFVTSGFMHMDIFHLLMNVMALISVGTVCEKVFRKRSYGIILITSIIVGNMFAFIGAGNMLSLGISGGVFGLFGAFLVSLYETGSIKHPIVKASVIRLLMINVIISLLPGVSMYAHLGGFMTGIFLGIVLVPSTRWKALKKHVLISFMLLIGALSGFCLRVNTVDPLVKSVDVELLQTVRALGFDRYAEYMHDRYLNFYTEEDLE